jgi:hypothetical protein
LGRPIHNEKDPLDCPVFALDVGADDALPLKRPDFGTALDMGILAMCSITDSDNRNTAEQIEAAKTGLSQACREGQI